MWITTALGRKRIAKYQIFRNWVGPEPAAIPPMATHIKRKLGGLLFVRVTIVINDLGERVVGIYHE